MMVPLKYLSNFWKSLEMPLINCEINFDLNWSKYCIIVASNDDQETTFSITDIKHFVPVVTLSTQDNAKLLEQLKSGFKRTINWNKYQQALDADRKAIQKINFTGHLNRGEGAIIFSLLKKQKKLL